MHDCLRKHINQLRALKGNKRNGYIKGYPNSSRRVSQHRSTNTVRPFAGCLGPGGPGGGSAEVGLATLPLATSPTGHLPT